jgi:hypothetical protein
LPLVARPVCECKTEFVILLSILSMPPPWVTRLSYRNPGWDRKADSVPKTVGVVVRREG